MNTATLPDLLGYEDLPAYGLARHALDLLLKPGEFERISPGLFLRAELTDDTTAVDLDHVKEARCDPVSPHCAVIA